MSVATAAKAVETVTSQKEAAKAKLKTKDEELRELRAYKKDTEALRAQCEADASTLARLVRLRPSASVPSSPHLCAVLLQKAMKAPAAKDALRREITQAYENKTLEPTVAGLRRVAAATKDVAAQDYLELVLDVKRLVRKQDLG
jgi:hypothetical protein